MSGIAKDRVSRMCAIWSEVLGTQVEPEDDFFALGGDSLSAMNIEVLVEKKLGLSIDFRSFFNAATPSALVAEAVARSQRDAD
jgi:phthiocerol/phenolphthiocerol synthesis type-I polyketide synthase E